MQDHGARQHHRFGGSGMARIMLCPGSYNMSRAVPAETPSRAAQRGTLAHEIIDSALKARERSADVAALPFIAHELFDDEIVAGAQLCIDHVFEILDAYGDDAVLYCEEEFILDSMADDDVGGFCDIAIWIATLNLLYVIDYKNGVQLVEAADNKQLLFYATGAVAKLAQGADTIIGQIVQPNAFHREGKVREFLVGRDRIDNYAVEIDEAIIEAKRPDAPIIPGEYQCEWCPARAFCPAREQAAVQVANKSFATVRHVNAAPLPSPADLSGDRLAEIMLSAPMLRDWLDDVERAAYAMALANPNSVPGFKIVEAQARRKWFGEPAQVAAALQELLGEDADVVFPRKLMTITDAEKHLKKRYTAGLKTKAEKDKYLTAAYEALARLTDKNTSGNLTLVHESDRRQPASSKATSVTFSTVALPAPSHAV